ncbi:hypothetical protein C8Q77DRAFT_1141460 [Trametes polyzona]|nr:hypothetical protein C8Q77DRAFT_1141460 [Trametes polyzona]
MHARSTRLDTHEQAAGRAMRPPRVVERGGVGIVYEAYAAPLTPLDTGSPPSSRFLHFPCPLLRLLCIDRLDFDNMGILSVFFWFIFGFCVFVFLRQLPSHKLYVLERDLREVQTYYTLRVEEGFLSGAYRADYPQRLSKLQSEADKLRAIMADVWPFSIRDFWHIFDGVTSQCYKLRDQVEVLMRDLKGAIRHEELRSGSYGYGYRTNPVKPASSDFSAYAMDTSIYMPRTADTSPALSSPRHTPQAFCTPGGGFAAAVQSTHPL